MNRPVLIILLLSVALKAILTFGVVREWGLNWDENSAWTVAQNHINGHGYALFDEASQSYQPTAFHGAFTVLLYERFIQAGISQNTWALFVHIVSLLLFALSVGYFYRLAALYCDGEAIRIGATLTYAFYPSVQYYIGTMMLYENFAGALLVIVLFYLIRTQGSPHRHREFLILPLLVSLSCWFRPQLIVICTGIIILFLILGPSRRYLLIVALLSAALTFSGFIPTLQKNKLMFGEYSLGNQSGFELLQGHSPVARGSWMSGWRDHKSPLYQYAQANIPGLDSMNEFEQAKARKDLAIDWALHNPGKEVVLTLRKLAIYFLPDNYESMDAIPWLNIVTLLVHLLFLSGTAWLFWKKKLSRKEMYLYLPVIASLGLTVLFYVGYRWRFYAEPFMILIAWIFLNERIKELKNEKIE